MSFIWPVMLVSLISIPICIGIYLSLLKRRKRILVSYGDFPGTTTNSRQPGRQRHIPPVLFLLGLTLLSLAMARPQMTVNLPRAEGTVMLVFDTSGSMAADDVQPNRITAAKESAYQFVNSQPSTVQIGVVAFSESGISVQAPTNDKDAILTSISRLQPQQGTSLGFGILTALKVLAINSGAPQTSGGTPTVEATPIPTPVPVGHKGPAIIVLISDGENTAPPDPFEAAYQAAQAGVRIDAIGIGTTAGANLQINGYFIHTQMNDVALEQISGLTGGDYFAAGSMQDLSKIYSQISPELVIKPEQMEVTSLIAGASLVLLLIGGWLTLIWFGRLP